MTKNTATAPMPITLSKIVFGEDYSMMKIPYKKLSSKVSSSSNLFVIINWYIRLKDSFV
jgi:hypothetical protein